MSEDLYIPSCATKKERYEALLPQIKALITSESDVIANMGNMAAAIKETFGFLWVGFYVVKGNELVLGPFQGPVACTRIRYGRGVCGTSWKEERALIVPDVNAFPGHIACSSLSQSEIVIPIFSDEHMVAVLDVDSVELNSFDEEDAFYLKKMVEMLKF